MLIEFRVSNYLSFKQMATFSMVASSISGHESTNIVESQKLRLLKSASIYGANSSGKSNLVKALKLMRELVLTSASKELDKQIPVEPYKLSKENLKKPSYFEIIISIEGHKYRYGFEVDKQSVHSEWLFNTPKSREAELFTRDSNAYSLSRNFKEGKGLEAKTREDALFLSVVAQFNGEHASKIVEWFESLMVMSESDLLFGKSFAHHVLREHAKQYKQLILDLLNAFSIDIVDIELADGDLSAPPGQIRPAHNKSHIIARRKLYSRTKEVGLADFDLDEEESDGTKKLFSLLGAIIFAIQRNKILVIDELDARMHPLLTRTILQMFNSPDNEKTQIIFTTHDTNLLDQRILRRDQIWFTEKDKYGASCLYSLAEYRPRKDASLEKDYIQGRYGAIPYIGGVGRLLGEK